MFQKITSEFNEATYLFNNLIVEQWNAVIQGVILGLIH